MGAELSLYSSYSLGEPFKVENDIWEISPALSKEDDQEFTVFLHDKENQSNKVDTAIKYFQKLRHPGLLKCVEVFQEASEIAIVTEAVVPLTEVVGDFHLLEVIAGIHNIIVTLVFLHDKCKLSHNNLSLDSIFVGQNDACWKIGGFEYMCPFAEIAKEKLMNESIAHAKDVLGLGKLICDVLDVVSLSDESSITDFQQRIQEEVVDASLEKRPSVQSLLNDEIFQNDYCQILDFLRNITVKTSGGKAVFFRTLHQRLHKVPPHIIANRLLHLLLSRFTLVDSTAVDVFLPHLLTPQSDHSVESADILPLLPEDLFRQCCVPILKKLFEVNDRHVRLILLKYFPLYVSMFDKDALQSFILPELRLGLQDSDDELVSATFSAMQYLVPVLGAHVIIGGERLQQFTERRPKLDVESKSSHGSESHRIKQDSSQRIATRASQGKSLQDKIQEREKRREETRKRNEERRKQKSQMGKKIAMKASVVEHVHVESAAGSFDSWDNFDGVEKVDPGEISDDSDHGRPSSSEVSLDSGFSERTRNVIEHPTSPRQTKQVNCTEDINKFSQGKTGFGMKLGKVKGDSKLEKDRGKKLALKDIAKQNESQLQNVSRTNKNDLKINTNSRAVNSSFETEYEDMHSNELPEDSFNTENNELSPVSLNSTNKNSKRSTKNKLNKKDSKALRNTDKSKTPVQVVDKPWEDFGIKVTKKDSTVDDIFADMAPTLVETRKAPVKGTSMYSDNLAVVAETTEQDLNGWLDDDW
ncbi:protein-associating with the carboxyl-terminal domain of ezrin-like isoform X2 [Dendronephthya gigantea]|uniref:protein-associating with the carboxyl-terminal domain of ezrin-like isoform X2 n=1 Tax=Dendronephthya gigantea TaxID=151771 RepID=UPI00106BA1EF|nr:protein-associating with the carboxyl-terminal domain of ezrin-like isoform X2 [Dendronephthya gigantea]